MPEMPAPTMSTSTELRAPVVVAMLTIVSAAPTSGNGWRGSGWRKAGTKTPFGLIQVFDLRRRSEPRHSEPDRQPGVVLREPGRPGRARRHPAQLRELQLRVERVA